MNFSPDQVTDTIADLLSFLHVARTTNALKVIAADPADDKVLECALVSGASHIVTGDRRHLLPIGNYQGVAIVSAADFLVGLSATSVST